MPFPKATNLRGLSDAEITEEILALKKELFTYRFQQGTRQTVKPHLIKQAKHKLAQLLTLEQERKRSQPIVATEETT